MGGTTEFEEVLASRYVARIEVGGAGVDASENLLGLSGGGNKAVPSDCRE